MTQASPAPASVTAVTAAAGRSCPQKAWLAYRRTVAEVLSPPDELMPICGMSIGFEDPAAVHVRIDRAPLAKTVTFLD